MTNDYERDQLNARNEGAGIPTNDINVSLVLTHGGFLKEKEKVSIHR